MREEISILVVDDDTDDHEFLKEAFSTNEFSGVLAFVTDGYQLIDYLSQHKKREAKEKTLPHLIVLDLNMPLFDGFQALREIKNDPDLKDIPVAILTSSTRPEDEDVCYSLGCDKFYRKPLTVSEYKMLAGNIIEDVKSA